MEDGKKNRNEWLWKIPKHFDNRTTMVKNEGGKKREPNYFLSAQIMTDKRDVIFHQFIVIDKSIFFSTFF